MNTRLAITSAIERPSLGPVASAPAWGPGRFTSHAAGTRCQRQLRHAPGQDEDRAQPGEGGA